MKVIFVIGSMHYSGAEKVFREIIKGLAIIGYEMEVILLNDKNIYREEGIKFHYLLSRGNRLSSLLRRLKMIRLIVKKSRPNLVVSFGNVSNINVIVALLFLKIKILVCERNDPKHDPRTAFKRLFRNFIYNFADFFMFQTEDIKSYFPRKIQKNSFIIPNPVSMIEEPIINYNNRLIVTFARLDNYQKQLLKLIDIAIELHKRQQFHLYIYGDGPDEEKLKMAISQKKADQFVFLKGKSSNTIKDMSQASIFALTSRFEGMPNSLMEAMALGLACITTNFSGGGARALIVNGINGIIAVDDSDYIEKLSLLLNSTELCKNLGSQSKNILVTHSISETLYKWDGMLKKIMEC
jgi:glycosyltransferase involved in cell wall biosynthesis